MVVEPADFLGQGGGGREDLGELPGSWRCTGQRRQRKEGVWAVLTECVSYIHGSCPTSEPERWLWICIL